MIYQSLWRRYTVTSFLLVFFPVMFLTQYYRTNSHFKLFQWDQGCSLAVEPRPQIYEPLALIPSPPKFQLNENWFRSYWSSSAVGNWSRNIFFLILNQSKKPGFLSIRELTFLTKLISIQELNKHLYFIIFFPQYFE